jgi:hypothetical protein
MSFWVGSGGRGIGMFFISSNDIFCKAPHLALSLKSLERFDDNTNCK